MKQLIFVVRDATIEASMRPIFFATKEQATRAFSFSCVNPQSDLAQDPDDYTLYQIGTYDDETQQLEGHDPIRIMTGFEAVASAHARQAKLEALQSEISQLNGEGHA